MDFRIILKGTAKQNLQILTFHLQINFYGYILPSEFKSSISFESYDEKTAENYWNYYVAEKRIGSKL